MTIDAETIDMETINLDMIDAKMIKWKKDADGTVIHYLHYDILGTSQLKFRYGCHFFPARQV